MPSRHDPGREVQLALPRVQPSTGGLHQRRELGVGVG